MREMKDSGVEWIGEIDASFKIFSIGSLFSIKKRIIGHEPERVLSITQTGIRPKNTESNEGQNANTYEHYQIVNRGDFAMNHMDLLTGWVDISKYEGVTSPDYRVFTIKDQAMVSEYFLRVFQYYYANRVFFGFGQGVATLGRWRLPAQNFKTIAVPVPPVEKQKRINDAIEIKASQVDSLISNVQTQIEKLKQYKQSLITEVVTKGLDPTVPMKDSGVEWIGEIPAHWSVSRIGRHSTVILGKMLCTTQLTTEYTLEPYYCAANVHFDGIDLTTQKYMWFNKTEKKQYLVHAGDLLVVEGGAGAGGCAIASAVDGVSTFIQNSIMILRQDASYDVRYSRYLLESLVKRGYIELVCNKATIPHFTKDKLSAVPYPIAPKDEQKEIADYLDSKCAQIDRLISIKQDKIEKLNAYKKSLIYEYVTGKKEV